MALFESYERRIDKINGVLAQYGISSVEECREICKAKGFDPYEIVKGIQPICFENACWAYCVGAAIALKKGVKTAAEAAEAIGIGLPGNGTIPAVYSKRLQLGRRAGAAWARGRAGGAPGVIRLVYLMCPLLRLPRPRLSPGAYPTTEF